MASTTEPISLDLLQTALTRARAQIRVTVETIDTLSANEPVERAKLLIELRRLEDYARQSRWLAEQIGEQI